MHAKPGHAGAEPPLVSTRIRLGAKTFLVLMVVWLALSGLRGWWLGLAFAALGALARARMAVADPYPWRPLRPLRLLAFFGYFLRASLLGGLDVARRALDPALPIEPHFLRHPLRVPHGPPRTLMLSVVSLLPGTLGADIEGDELLVHALSADSAAGVLDLEHRIALLFSMEDRTT
jgi:multicomponent Na+:H+ antiporter subunit E